MSVNVEIEKLLVMLDEARELLAQFSGGYSSEFFSAEEFHGALKKCIEELKSGDFSSLEKLRIWFLPTSCWDDFTGMDGLDLGNRISQQLAELRKD